MREKKYLMLRMSLFWFKENDRNIKLQYANEYLIQKDRTISFEEHTNTCKSAAAPRILYNLPGPSFLPSSLPWNPSFFSTGLGQLHLPHFCTCLPRSNATMLHRIGTSAGRPQRYCDPASLVKSRVVFALWLLPNHSRLSCSVYPAFF